MLPCLYFFAIRSIKYHSILYLFFVNSVADDHENFRSNLINLLIVNFTILSVGRKKTKTFKLNVIACVLNNSVKFN